MLSSSYASASTTEVFERLLPIETRTGVVRLYTVETPRLELPTIEEGKPTVWSERQYARLYAIEFALEVKRADEAPILEDRGNIVLTLGLPPDNLKMFDQQLRAHLASLGADAFHQPHAGLYEGNPPFDFIGVSADPPSWTCKTGMERARSRVMEFRPTYREEKIGERTVRLPVGHSGRDHAKDDIPERVCEALLRGAAGSASGAHEMRTLSVPRQVRELSVGLEIADRLPRDVLTKNLASLPSGARWTRTHEESGNSGTQYGTGGGFRRENGQFIPIDILDAEANEALWLLSHEQWEATTAPAAVGPSVLAAGSFVARWILEETTRTLGPQPQRKTRPIAELTLALVPVAVPPLTRDGVTAEPDPGPVTPALDSTDWVAEVARKLDEAATLDGAVLEGAVVDTKPEAFRGFLLLACRDDGTAWYGLPPTRARSRVLDPAPLCAAVRAKLK